MRVEGESGRELGRAKLDCTAAELDSSHCDANCGVCTFCTLWSVHKAALSLAGHGPCDEHHMTLVSLLLDVLWQQTPLQADGTLLI